MEQIPFFHHQVSCINPIMYREGLERWRNHALGFNFLLLLHQFLASDLKGHSKTELSRLLKPNTLDNSTLTGSEMV